MSILVITPTTGSSELKQAILSVQQQDIEVEHLLVVDGVQFYDQVNSTVSEVLHHPDFNRNKIPSSCVLPYNTGGNGFYGHRIMAAFSFLINHDYVLFLDQDNWFETNHVSSLIGEITKYNFDWCYSLRNIYDKDGNYLLPDNCESLGMWPAWVDSQAFLVDSSTYCFKTSFLRKVGHIWDFGWGADRRFYQIIKDQIQHRNYSCSGKHTLCYRLGGNEGSVNKSFFIEGNERMLQKYGDESKMPWHKQYK